MSDRDHAATARFDLVLFGATGFTGRLTARYLAAQVPPGCRWAVAGRNAAKLAEVQDALDGHAAPEILVADVTDADSVRAMASAARVVISTVGPYLDYGEPLVAACAEAGTDYVDLTGEPEFVDRMYCRYQAIAERSGARLVHSCGFDSVPHDLGVLFTVRQLPSDVPITVDGVVRAAGHLSGGTLHSALVATSRIRGAAQAARQRKAIEPRPSEGRRARAIPTAPRRVDGRWLLPLPTIDPLVVARSARALPEYGPDFEYHHYAGFRHLPVAVAAAVATGAFVGLAQLPPTRALLGRLIDRGEGPSQDRRAGSWFRVRFRAVSGDRTVVTEVSGGDPGYDETSKILAESALCLAFDELPATSGQLTTAVAMGDALIARLVAAGITFTVLVDTTTR